MRFGSGTQLSFEHFGASLMRHVPGVAVQFCEPAVVLLEQGGRAMNEELALAGREAGHDRKFRQHESS
jgi:hypothetical protein